MWRERPYRVLTLLRSNKKKIVVSQRKLKDPFLFFSAIGILFTGKINFEEINYVNDDYIGSN